MYGPTFQGMQDMYYVGMGLLIGFAVVLPVGPLNLEIIRRSLCFGLLEGIILGAGAIIADIIYLFLLSLGYLSLLNNEAVLRIIGIFGSLVIAYFGYQAITSSTAFVQKETECTKSYVRQGIEGFLIAFLNPFVILFWLSLSAQIAALAHSNFSLFALTSFGVILSAVLWLFFLSSFIHFTKTKITERFLKVINKIGGFLLVGFSIYGVLTHSVFAY